MERARTDLVNAGLVQDLQLIQGEPSVTAVLGEPPAKVART